MPSPNSSPDEGSSRRSSIASPQLDTPNPILAPSMGRSPSPNPKGMLGEDVFSVPPPLGLPFESREDELSFAPSASRAVNATGNRRTTLAGDRAAAPPPILVRRPTELPNRADPGPSYTATPSRRGSGLNILGIPDPTGSIEKEAADTVPPLVPTPSPRRSAFRSALNNADGAPPSPAWPSLDQSSPRPYSLEVPTVGSPLTGRHFDPTPQHGLHARNLSLYFPQPGQSSKGTPGSPLFASPEEIQHSVMAGTEGDRSVFGGSGNWSFGKSVEAKTPETRGKRRGHHHKHSLSHNFFSFLDPTQTNPRLTSPSSPQIMSPSDKPLSVPMPHSSAFTTTLSLSPLPPVKSDPQKQFLTSFAVLEFLIGAGLWVEGQMSGWRCLAGVGYLVVFDSLGVGIEVVQWKGLSGNLRRPYGIPRLLALLYFAQSLFLVFSAVYIAKESLEQVILGAHAHGDAVGGAHSHGEVSTEGDERPFPLFLLFSATLAAIFSGGWLENHAKLVDAVGTLFLPIRWTNLQMVKKHPSLLRNPFSLGAAGASLAVLLGSLLVPAASLHSLDSALSLLLTLLTSALSYPPTLAFGHVLLQTAPPGRQTQMTALRKALKEINEDRRVIGIGRTRCWAVTSGTSYFEQQHSSTPSNSHPTTPRGSVTSFPSGSSPSSPSSPRFVDHLMQGLEGKDASTPLVVTVEIHVSVDIPEREVLELTRDTWGRLSRAVRGGEGGGEGEISVGIKRGWGGEEGGSSGVWAG